MSFGRLWNSWSYAFGVLIPKMWMGATNATPPAAARAATPPCVKSRVASMRSARRPTFEANCDAVV
jgi:hypothetical protein